MHIVIIANGQLADTSLGRDVARRADILVCADGGTRHALAWDLTPDVLIGDMDSLDAAILKGLPASTRVIRHPAHKDYTDLELALEFAIGEGATEITILGALGGRLDQSLANILLLVAPRFRPASIRILDGPDHLFLARGPVVLHGTPGDLVSLLPLSPEVTDVTTAGLEYPLHGETLYLGLTRGVSNAMLAHEATITFGAGLLLVCHRVSAGSDL
jgi:thiamine pyrophosphokinase